MPLKTARFLYHFLKAPGKIGAIAPSSPVLANAMASMLPEQCDVVLEVGPGNGAITRELNKRTNIAKLVLCEINPAFCKSLRKEFPHLTVLNCDLSEVHEHLSLQEGEHISAIVSSLPLKAFPVELSQRLVKDMFNLLPAGAPLVQFTYARTSPILLEPLKRQGYRVQSKKVWRNLPPATVWCYQKVV